MFTSHRLRALHALTADSCNHLVHRIYNEIQQNKYTDLRVRIAYYYDIFIKLSNTGLKSLPSIVTKLSLLPFLSIVHYLYFILLIFYPLLVYCPTYVNKNTKVSLISGIICRLHDRCNGMRVVRSVGVGDADGAQRNAPRHATLHGVQRAARTLLVQHLLLSAAGRHLWVQILMTV